MNIEQRQTYIKELVLEGETASGYSYAAPPMADESRPKFGVVQPPPPESVGAGPPPTPDAFVVGSHMAEYATDVSLEERILVNNSLLLAQLAANKAVGAKAGATIDWYEKYVEVLQKSGWFFSDDLDINKEAQEVAAEVHVEILPLLALPIVGPGAAAVAAVITEVLQGLHNMDRNRRWITIFERESRRVTANQFQVSYAKKVDGLLQIWLTCFELEAENTVTQVLFFNFSNENATLKYATSEMTAAPDLARMHSDISAKVSEYIAANIAAIEI